MNDEELISRFDKIDSSLELLNEKVDFMATKSELLEVQAIAQDASFARNKINWFISALIGTVTFLIGLFWPFGK